MRFQQAPYLIADVVALLFIAHGNTSFGFLAPIIPYRSCKHYLKKVDMEGNPLAGATFRLTKMNGELVGEYTTGRNGFVTIPELDPGWYVAVEIKAPDGYKLNNIPQKVELKAGEPAILEFENEELPHLQTRPSRKAACGWRSAWKSWTASALEILRPTRRV
ncbi:prealbumin-like fold domain-containing protein [Ruthenibacterium lactatiformans]|uniref:prealbumin-like fold domain-containing protein n=1 Tax=Ruthenibacterium lactatiformans TaxID=1550024 RepID=UPI0039A26180